jgi:hypothetical protein
VHRNQHLHPAAFSWVSPTPVPTLAITALVGPLPPNTQLSTHMCTISFQQVRHSAHSKLTASKYFKLLRKNSSFPETDQWRQARARAWASGNKLTPQKANSRRKNVQTCFRTVLWPVLARGRPWPARFVHLSRELTMQWWHCTDWLFGGSKWSFYVTRCKHRLIFRAPLRAVAGTLAHLFVPTSAGCILPRGPSHLHALLRSSRRTNQNFGLLTWISPLKLTDRTDLRRPGQGPSYLCYFPRNCVHAVCVFSQCDVLGYPFRTSTSPPTNVAREVRDHAEIREDK